MCLPVSSHLDCPCRLTPDGQMGGASSTPDSSSAAVEQHHVHLSVRNLVLNNCVKIGLLVNVRFLWGLLDGGFDGRKYRCGYIGDRGKEGCAKDCK